MHAYRCPKEITIVKLIISLKLVLIYSVEHYNYKESSKSIAKVPIVIINVWSVCEWRLEYNISNRGSASSTKPWLLSQSDQRRNSEAIACMNRTVSTLFCKILFLACTYSLGRTTSKMYHSRLGK